MASRLLLVRHAVVESAYRGKLIGRTDAALAAGFEEQMKRVGEMLRAEGCGVVVASPISRARRCAECLGLPLEIDADLAEIDFGTWDGKTFAEMDAADPVTSGKFKEWATDLAFPGGEPIEGFVARVTAATRRLCAREEEAVAVVSHGGVIRQMICHLLGLSTRQYLLFDVQCGKVAKVNVFGERGVLAGLNCS